MFYDLLIVQCRFMLCVHILHVKGTHTDAEQLL